MQGFCYVVAKWLPAPTNCYWRGSGYVRNDLNMCNCMDLVCIGVLIHVYLCTYVRTLLVLQAVARQHLHCEENDL